MKIDLTEEQIMYLLDCIHSHKRANKDIVISLGSESGDKQEKLMLVEKQAASVTEALLDALATYERHRATRDI